MSKDFIFFISVERSNFRCCKTDRRGDFNTSFYTVKKTYELLRHTVHILQPSSFDHLFSLSPPSVKCLNQFLS